MANWNNNAVTIYAPLEVVKTWLIRLSPEDQDHPVYLFNMHKLFPDRFQSDNQHGTLAGDDGWYDDNTGSTWPPDIHLDDDVNATYLGYDTVRAPNNGTLIRLHKLTGWTIINEFEEPGCGFEGTLTCDEHGITDEQRDYRPLCEVCDKKHPAEEYVDDADDRVCRQCRAEDQKPFPAENPRPHLFTEREYQGLLDNGRKASVHSDFDPMPVVRLRAPGSSASWLLAMIET